MFSLNISFPFKGLFIAIVFFLLCLNLSASETKCLFKNPCQCVFENSSVIDLSSLGNHNNIARWQSMKPTQGNNSYEYYYNPCFSFKLGADGACSKGVSVCQVDMKNHQYYDLGDTESVNFVVDNENILQLIYHAAPRITNVSLICDKTATTPELTVKGEVKINLYEMTLKSRCACPDLCSNSHLSTGSVLVILFMIFVAMYLILGIIHSSLTRGAHGWELIPHYEFWADFPLLVRDGCVFVFSGCKPETAYERI